MIDPFAALERQRDSLVLYGARRGAGRKTYATAWRAERLLLGRPGIVPVTGRTPAVCEAGRRRGRRARF
jgi:hypothetical protein